MLLTSYAAYSAQHLQQQFKAFAPAVLRVEIPTRIGASSTPLSAKSLSASSASLPLCLLLEKPGGMWIVHCAGHTLMNASISLHQVAQNSPRSGQVTHVHNKKAGFILQFAMRSFMCANGSMCCLWEKGFIPQPSLHTILWGLVGLLTSRMSNRSNMPTNLLARRAFKKSIDIS